MICHHYQCIFVHIPKNAGQSIEHVFLDLLGLDWQTRAPLLLRPNDRPELGPPSLAHLKADEYVRHRYLTQEIFDSYFKFSFIRNPWDRLVSIYKYLGYERRYGFKQFLTGPFTDLAVKDNHWFFVPQSDYIYDDSGKLLVDFVGRFEALQDDFQSICQQLGLPSLKVPHVNQSKCLRTPSGWQPKTIAKYVLYKLKKRNISSFSRYQDYYDDESVAMVEEVYKRDVDLFGYRFGL